MPLYEVFHAVPLSRQQKDALAAFITDLHSTTFVAPRFFVNVRFEQTQPAGDLYAAGKHRGNQSPNHIIATVRVGPARTKELFHEAAFKLNKKWDEVVNDATLGAHSLGHLPAKQARQVKNLKVIAFQGLLATVENGLAVPEPGDEKTWIMDNKAYFQQQVDEYDDDDFKEILEEINGGADTKTLL